MDSATVQHVTKASSDELLWKFAELGSESGDESSTKRQSRVSKRQKRSTTEHDGDNYEQNPSNGSTSLVERRSLLPLVMTRRSVLLRQLGIGRPRFRVGEIKSKSFVEAIEKTWRKTVEGASKVFIERHYNRHKRLINDIV